MKASKSRSSVRKRSAFSERSRSVSRPFKTAKSKGSVLSWRRSDYAKSKERKRPRCSRKTLSRNSRQRRNWRNDCARLGRSTLSRAKDPVVVRGRSSQRIWR